MNRSVDLPYRHARYTLLRLVRAGGGLTVLPALGALAVLLLLLGRPETSAGDRGSAVLAAALLAATASTLVHTVLLTADERQHAWDEYLNTLPGYGWTRTLTFLVATCVVGMLAASPVAFMGVMQASEPDAAGWASLLLVPVAALPGLLLGMLLARIRSARRRQVSSGVVLLILPAGALVAVGAGLPGWAEWLGALTPTFAASRTLIPIMNHEPFSTPSLALWVIWCLTPLLILCSLDRHRLRRLP